ncbi:hypothetical protein [Streptomyces zagrosensis]|uniref:DUF559 domain-containing protein n=1 Tax=Streptomyces zagrosensis TaxID=1042984 RepID=A0A7W9UXS1_9ACTN|nr:hypothetical protein [Streptomyces zagrosensis]MBB5934922.1 hypothetical protein [Streptomyces zagrosensis]
MTHDFMAPRGVAAPLPLRHLSAVQRRVMTVNQLREHGVPAAVVAERGRPGGPWQQVLPGVYLLHAGRPSGAERVQAALLYAAPPGTDHGAHPAALVTGAAALALHGFASMPPLAALERIDILVSRSLQRPRSTAFAQLLSTGALPRPRDITGLPVAPVARALADVVGSLSDADDVRALLLEAVRDGHGEASTVVRELTAAQLLDRPQVRGAIEGLLAESRAVAEGLLYRMVREYGLPEPLWNVGLRRLGGPYLATVDAYWPDQAVAVELIARGPQGDEDTPWPQDARRREHLEELGITVIQLTARRLRESLERRAAAVRAALLASADREPPAYVTILPR